MSATKVIELKGHTGRVWGCDFHPNGNSIASCGSDHTIRIWHKERGGWQQRHVLDGQHSRTIRAVSYSPCGNFLASASFDGTACIYEQTEGEWDCLATLEGHENEVKGVSWSASGQLLATCSRDKSVWIWEIEDDDQEFDVQCLSVLQSHTQDVKAVIWHPQNETLASASYDNSVKLYRDDPQDWMCYDTLTGHTSTVWKCAFNGTGDRLCSVSDDHSIKIWQAYKPGNALGIETNGVDPKWSCVATLSGHHDRPIYDIVWSNKTGMIATAAGDNNIKIFKEEEGGSADAPSFSVLASIPNAHSEDVNSIAWSPTEAILASGSDDGVVALWQITE